MHLYRDESRKGTQICASAKYFQFMTILECQCSNTKYFLYHSIVSNRDHVGNLPGVTQREQIVDALVLRLYFYALKQNNMQKTTCRGQHLPIETSLNNNMQKKIFISQARVIHSQLGDHNDQLVIHNMPKCPNFINHPEHVFCQCGNYAVIYL